MAEAENAPQPRTFRDRSARLALFGVVAVAFGLMAVMLGALQLLVALVAGESSANEAFASDPIAAAMGALTLGMIGGCLVLVGVGSVRKKRWVQPMMLTLAWSWLLAGLMALLLLPGLVGVALDMSAATLDPQVVAITKTLLIRIMNRNV